MKYFLIFAYGSLVNFDSAERTLHRKPAQSEVTLAWITGYERVWDYKSVVYADTLGKKTDAVFLNLRLSPLSRVNGIIFRVNEEELSRLRLREANYALVDITSSLAEPGKEPVFTFICSDTEALAQPQSDCIVMKKYIELVKSGFCNQGDQFYEDYLNTTREFSFKIVEGGYSFPSN